VTNEQRTLRKLIGDGSYTVDAKAVATAIVARAKVRATVANAGFHSDITVPPIRSFRRDSGARSFRLSRPSGLQRPYH
jgi:TPP-dependent trihydroxycyclohexane-1,2-dione (THcHDO) dehydratase